uniref:Basic tail secreted protein n=1 Tax=Rhipicephalus zambeziensis TaxID=60191 RepID=A0A224YAW4_9ACAR
MIYIISIAVIFAGHTCYSYKVLPEWGPCHSVLSNFTAKRSCYYKCYNKNYRWESGMYGDGTNCVHPTFFRRIGTCMRGNCILPTDEGPHINNTIPEEPCDGLYHGRGYAPKCTYTCTHRGRTKRGPYPAGTLCIPTNKQGQRTGHAGMCMHGICQSYEDLVTTHANIEKKVFSTEYHKCPDKDHYGKNVLWSCYYYCNQTGAWFFGHYKSNRNSACELFQPDHKLGWCCKGQCIPQANCGHAESTTRGPM